MCGDLTGAVVKSIRETRLKWKKRSQTTDFVWCARRPRNHLSLSKENHRLGSIGYKWPWLLPDKTIEPEWTRVYLGFYLHQWDEPRVPSSVTSSETWDNCNNWKYLERYTHDCKSDDGDQIDKRHDKSFHIWSSTFKRRNPGTWYLCLMSLTC